MYIFSNVNFIELIVLLIFVTSYKRHRVFKGLAGRGKSSIGWFYLFKLHIIINGLGEIINLKITSGSVHDVALLESLTQALKGILLGDKGYLSKEKTEALAAKTKTIDPLT